jgi:hypothetical protein
LEIRDDAEGTIPAWHSGLSSFEKLQISLIEVVAMADKNNGSFLLENRGGRRLTVVFEPEADECELETGETITIEQSFRSQPATVRIDLTPGGSVAVVIWPGDGTFSVKKGDAIIR